MALTRAQRRHLQRHAGTRSAVQLAAELGVPLREVEQALGPPPLPGAPHGARPPASSPWAAVPWGDGVYLLLLVLAVLAPWVVWDEALESAVLPKRAFIEVGAMALLALYALRGWWRGGERLRHPALLAVLGALVAWSWVSLLWTRDWYLGLQSCALWTAGLALFFVALQVLNEPGRAHLLLRAVSVSAGLLAVVGLLQYLLPAAWGAYPFLQSVPPAMAFANKNMGAEFIVVTLPAALVAWLLARRLSTLCVASAVLVLLLVYLGDTQTKGSWVAGAAVLLAATALGLRHLWRTRRAAGSVSAPPAPGPVTPAFTRRRADASMAVVVLVFVGINLTPTGFHWQVGDMLRMLHTTATHAVQRDTPAAPGPAADALTQRAAGSVDVRLVYAHVALRMWHDHRWLGVGMRGYSSYYPQYLRYEDHDPGNNMSVMPEAPHDDYLAVACELGLVGLALLLSALALLAAAVWRFLRAPPGQPLTLAATAGLLGLVGGLANAAFSYPMYGQVFPLYLALWAALLLSGVPARAPVVAAAPVPRQAPRLLLALGLTAAVLLLLTIIWQGRLLLGDSQVKLVLLAAMDNRPQIAVALGRRAQATDPWRLDTFQYIGESFSSANQAADALPYLQRNQQAYPDAPGLSFHIARCQLLLNRPADAAATLAVNLRLFPDVPRVQRLAGEIASARQDHATALAYFQRGWALAPTDSELAIKVAVELITLDRFADAAPILRRAVALAPGNVAAHLDLGLVCEHLQLQDEMLEHFATAVALAPNDPQAPALRAKLAQYGKIVPGPLPPPPMPPPPDAPPGALARPPGL